MRFFFTKSYIILKYVPILFSYLDKLVKLDIKTLRILQGKPLTMSVAELHLKYGSFPVVDLRKMQILTLFHKSLYHQST